MDLKSLNAFVHLSQTLQFSKTAEAKHVSPPTLSRMIQRLEEEFGYPLFERDNRSVKLTEQGARFKVFALQTINEWQQMLDELASQPDQLTGELNIYCTVTAAYSFLPDLIEEFQQLHPSVELKIQTGDVSLAIEKIESGEVDLALAARPDKLANKIAFTTIAHIPLHIIAPASHNEFEEQLNHHPIKWQYLPFIMPESGPARIHLDRWLKQMKIKPNIYAQVSGHEAIVSMVALGCGVSVAPSLVIENSPVKDKVKQLSFPVEPDPFNLGLSCLQKRINEPLVKAFWELI